MIDEHKVDITIKKKVDNYYIKEDCQEHITPERAIITLEKYTTTNKIDKIKKEINKEWQLIEKKLTKLK